ncbi:MAG: hypothetical protein H7Y13_10190 [Sphingobacteriaceae bacterium]|nr:hypothetical protein [Sphingobacteriaceae bacterium]
MKKMRLPLLILLAAIVIYSCKKSQNDAAQTSENLLEKELVLKLSKDQNLIYLVNNMMREGKERVAIMKSVEPSLFNKENMKSKSAILSSKEKELSAMYEKSEIIAQGMFHRMNLLKRFPEFRRLTLEQRKKVLNQAFKLARVAQKSKISQSSNRIMDEYSNCLDSCDAELTYRMSEVEVIFNIEYMIITDSYELCKEWCDDEPQPNVSREQCLENCRLDYFSQLYSLDIWYSFQYYIYYSQWENCSLGCDQYINP